jgi:N-acetylglutamate synthase-like GNAT family acetyltransferase
MIIEIKEIKAEDTYQIRHEVMWPDKPIDFVKVDEDTEGVHFGLFEDEKLVSIVSIFYKNDEMQFRKFATLADFQGSGYGTLLLNYIFQQAENQGIKKIWCNARSTKTAFYAKFGMHETDVRFVKGGIDYVVMKKII